MLPILLSPLLCGDNQNMTHVWPMQTIKWLTVHILISADKSFIILQQIKLIIPANILHDQNLIIPWIDMMNKIKILVQ